MLVILTRMVDRELMHICHQIIDYFVYEHDLYPHKVTDINWKTERIVQFFFGTVENKYWCPWLKMTDEALKTLIGETLTKEFFDEYFSELIESWKDRDRY